MDEVIVNQASEVKILHGTGNGILRQFIREYLQTVDFVVSVKDEKVELGGTGITVVNLKYR
jgi:DNA mismatch repair protein MutS2